MCICFLRRYFAVLKCLPALVVTNTHLCDITDNVKIQRLNKYVRTLPSCDTGHGLLSFLTKIEETIDLEMLEDIFHTYFNLITYRFLNVSELKTNFGC